MASKGTKFYATATIDGIEYTSTRTSHRPYTHAAFHQSGTYAVQRGAQAYFATFHASEALAAKSASDKACGAVYAIVAATTEAAPKAEPVAPTAAEPLPVPADAQPVDVTIRRYRGGAHITFGEYGVHCNVTATSTETTITITGLEPVFTASTLRRATRALVRHFGCKPGAIRTTK